MTGATLPYPQLFINSVVTTVFVCVWIWYCVCVYFEVLFSFNRLWSIYMIIIWFTWILNWRTSW